MTATLGHAFETLMLVMLAAVVGIVCAGEAQLSVILRTFVLISGVLLTALLGLNANFILQGSRPTNYLQPNNMASIAAVAMIILLASRTLWNWRWAQALFLPGMLLFNASLFAARSRSCLLVIAL